MSAVSDHVLKVLAGLPAAGGYWVAYSGGLDSRVLLELLAERRGALPGPLGAVHVDHGLHPDAPRWAAHCAGVCRGLGVPLVQLRANAAANAGDSPEAAARRARYGVLADWLPAGHCVLSAHHRDDQAETLLLQLLRGSGPRGLAAMPVAAPLAGGTLVRPLLEVDRATLAGVAQARGLDWIDDPSNADTDYDRNLLRHQVMPVLRARWPSASASLARSARHCADTAKLADTLAALDLQALQGTRPGTLSLAALRKLAPSRQRNVLRYWLRREGFAVPSAAVLGRILKDIPEARGDAEPRVCWAAAEVRRYRDQLYVLQALPSVDRGAEYCWQPDSPLELPASAGTLEAVPATGSGLAARFAGCGRLRVRFRRGGELFRPHGRPHRRALKKLFQEAGVPPWERERVPLLYVDGELGAVAGFWVGEGFQASGDEPGIELRWRLWKRCD
ncbi:MAG TPA: tRNA lysidine(34) synthetase TilS [Gammaproteobacteria bacterium]|nr:tRNA lysidine(34) synthetase TilS [Gammaproteobacteria bacterium]